MLDYISGMWSWTQGNATVFSALTSMGMLVIWGIYLQLLFHNFRMQRRPQVIINHGYGRGLDSRCIISNMSQKAVFIDTVVVEVVTENRSCKSDVTDTIDSASESGARELRQATRQGPLGSGEYMDAGRFRAMLASVAKEHGLGFQGDGGAGQKEKLKELEVQLVLIFGTESRPVGARRRFRADYNEDGELALAPETIGTQQLSKRRQRLRVRKWQRELEEG